MRRAPIARAVRRWRGALAVTGLCLLLRARAVAQELDAPPILYSDTVARDPVGRLNERLETGEVTLGHGAKGGYLVSVLDALGIPVSSQVLVFSKTSFQRQHITPRQPRAVYFSDEVYVGWVQGGEVVEISAVDPELGAVFYTLDQRKADRPRFVRRDSECLQCHASSMTRGVPGHLVRSVFPDPTGLPLLSAGSYLTDQSSPISERWGGWYVTGSSPSATHMGNQVYEDRATARPLAPDSPHTLASLNDVLDTGPYLSGHSDLVALLVLEHQTRMHNLITRASYQARLAIRDQEVLDRMLDEPSPEPSPSIVRRLEHAVEPLLEYLLFADEAPLPAPVRGSSRFAHEFQARGPRDGRGRSLRELDLQTRLFRYPCSYLIYSEAVAAIPAPARELLYRRLWTILTGRETSETFAHLSDPDRRAIFEILLETRQDLPPYWRPRGAAF